MTAILVGAALVAVGGWGLARWFGDVLIVLKGFGSLSLIIGGIVAVVAGFSSYRPARSNAPKE